MRRPAHQQQELFLAHRYEAWCRSGDRRGAARTVIDQCHFAEDAAFAERIQQPVTEADFDAAAFDHEQFLGRIAFPEDRFRQP